MQTDNEEESSGASICAEEYDDEEECGNSSVEDDVSGDFDSTEANAYLDKAIVGKFEELQFQWKNDCSDCLMQFDSFAELLTHIQISHNCDKLISCIVGDCAETFDNGNVAALARHIVIKHYDLTSLSIYITCPDCDRRFFNFLLFNKHSCARLKKAAGMRTYCDHCDQEFPSFKRYVFHMQYHLPKCRPMVCLLCAKRFNNVEHFFRHVQYRHEPATTYACEICDLVYKDAILYEQHNRQRHAKRRRYKCSYCPKQYNHNAGLVRHVNKCHNDAAELFKCDVCAKHYADKGQLRKHRQRHVLQADVQVNVCSVCGLIARDRDDLTDHVESSLSLCFRGKIEEDILSSAYTCVLCSQDFRSAADLRTHRATDVHKDGRYHCNMCDFHYDELKKLRAHMKSHESYTTMLESFPLTRLYLCNGANCEASYATWDGLYTHNKRVHPPSSVATQNTDMRNNCNEFRCHFCNKQYKQKMALSIHITRTHNSTNVVCSKCPCSFKEEKSLLEHISAAHTPVKCTQCEKVVRNRRYLKTHLRIMHKSEERHFCAKCKKGFFYRGDLEKHERVVHAEVMYQCGDCAFTTNYRRTMEVHEAKHRNMLEFKCHVCSKEFGRKKVLEAHIKRHDVSSQYRCSDRVKNGCLASFVTIALLNQHIQQKHPEVAEGADVPNVKQEIDEEQEFIEVTT